jgi:predicted PurR-regulated permease PerM
MTSSSSSFLTRVLTVAAVVGAAMLLWKTAQVALLAFAGVLAAILFRNLAEGLMQRLRLPLPASLAIVVLAVIGLFAGVAALVGPRLADDIGAFWQLLPQSFAQLKAILQRYGLGYLLTRPELAAQLGTAASALLDVARQSLNYLLGLLFVLIIAVFLAIEPALYAGGVLKLVPPARRQRFRQVLARLGRALWRWALGELAAAAIIGTTTAVGLWLLGVPFALLLGLLAGVLNIIPFLGPVLAAIPAVAIALAQSPSDAVYVVGLIIVLQHIEGYVVLPLILERAVSLPPALTLLAVVMLGMVFGFLGAFLAAPLLLVAIVLVQALYVEDVLGDRAELAGGP